METTAPAPLAHLKRDVRELVEEFLNCPLEDLPSEELCAIQQQIIVLREYYQNHKTRRGREWQYGKNRSRLVAYALAYFPYHVELVGMAIQEALPELDVLRDWDLAPNKDHFGVTRYALVGCGAAPELYGLLRHLASRLYSSGRRKDVTPNISISLFEPELNHWMNVVEAVTEPLIRRGSWLKTQLDEQRIRLKWSQDRERIPHLGIRGEYDFVLIQCVLNELGTRNWSAWLSQVMEYNVALGGIICVIDTDSRVHDHLKYLGFGHSVDLNLEWSESGPRKLDPITTGLLFGRVHGRIEKRYVSATASFWEKTTLAQGRRLPPRRASQTGREIRRPKWQSKS